MMVAVGTAAVGPVPMVALSVFHASATQLLGLLRSTLWARVTAEHPQVRDAVTELDLEHTIDVMRRLVAGCHPLHESATCPSEPSDDAKSTETKAEHVDTQQQHQQQAEEHDRDGRATALKGVAQVQARIHGQLQTFAEAARAHTEKWFASWRALDCPFDAALLRREHTLLLSRFALLRDVCQITAQWQPPAPASSAPPLPISPT